MSMCIIYFKIAYACELIAAGHRGVIRDVNVANHTVGRKCLHQRQHAVCVQVCLL